MNIKYKTNFKGYIPVPRGILNLIRDKEMTFNELGFFICLVMQADYDQRHQNYKYVLRDDKELSQNLGCNQATIFRNRKKLAKIGVVMCVEGNTQITNIDMFTTKGIREHLRKGLPIVSDSFTPLHWFMADDKDLYAKLHNNGSKYGL